MNAGNKNKTLMVLGAGLFQLPGIKRAMAMGYRVITVDYLPDNIGHKYSDQKIICSTIDAEGILKVAREARVDGIMTFCSDVAAFSVAYAAQNLGLRGATPEVTRIMTRKDVFRKYQKEAGLNAPEFIAARSFEEIGGFLEDPHRTLVFKPADNSGSRGITVVPPGSREEIQKAFNGALSFSRAGIVCVEEFVAGTEVGGDGFMLDGKLRYKAVTHKHKRGVVVTGHSLPDDLSDPARQAVFDEIEKCCVKLGYNDGPVNYDVVAHDRGATVLEIGPRNGGNGIAELMSYGKGLEVLDVGIQFAMGGPMGPDLSGDACKGCGSLIFGSSRAGVLKNIATREEVMARVGEVLECAFIKKPGDQIEKFEHGGAILGYAVFKCPSPPDYTKIADRVERALGLELTYDQER